MTVSGSGILRELAGNARRVPSPLTAFIGRENEMRAAGALLMREGVRLLILTGPGGAGKTRLAIELAREHEQDFADEVVFVDLSSLRDPALVPGAIAQEMGIIERGNRTALDGLAAHLRDKEVLLVLDNFEQVLEAGPLVVDLLGYAPHIKALITSRERLHLRGEYEFPVPPLQLPDTHSLPPVDRLTRYEAVRLFVERSSALKPDFTLNEQNAAAVAEICARLDGLPLAIELAAARTKLLSPESMLARLRNRLKLLTNGHKDLPVRQQTLRSTIEWSYDLLNDEEKRLFRRLAVFSGSRGMDAVEHVTVEYDYDIIDTLDLLASLVDKNLVLQAPSVDAGSDPRFTMLETIQEYARDRLEESGEAATVGKRHAEYFLSLAEQAEPELQGPKQALWLNRLEVEHNNLRAAMNWALDYGEAEMALRLGGAIQQFWKARGHLSEGRALLEDALARSAHAPTAARAKAAMAAGTLAEAQGDYARARTLLYESLEGFRKLEDRANIASTLRHLGNQARHEGDYDTAYSQLAEGLGLARQVGKRLDIAVLLGDLGIVAQALGDEEAARNYYEESLAIRRELRDRRGIAMMLVNLGELARAKGDYEAAYALYDEGLTIARELGDRWGVGMVLHNLGHVAYHRGRLEQAFDLFTESLRIFHELQNKRDIAYCLAALGGLFGAMLQPERAAVLFSAGQALSSTISSHLDPADLIEYERNLAAAQRQMSPDDWDNYWAKGQAMSLDEAVNYALEGSPPAQSHKVPSSPSLTTRPLSSLQTGPLREIPSGLSEREVEVLRLVAMGMTDNQVAEKLIISPRTVQRHLSSIFSKLDVTTRTAAARLAVEQKMV